MKLYFAVVHNITGELEFSQVTEGSSIYYHLPFPVICLLLYLWMVLTGKVRWLRPFWIFHVFMYFYCLSYLLTVLILETHIKLFVLVFISALICGFGYFFGLYGWILSNVLFLFTGESDFVRVYGCGVKNKNTFYLCTPFVIAVIGLSSLLINIVLETENCTYKLPLFEVMLIIPIIITLIIWFFWWIIIKKRENLSGLKIGYLINAMLCVIIHFVATLIEIIVKSTDKSSEIHHIMAFETTICYVPFTWILAAFLSRQSIIERIFHKKVPKEVEEFQLSYISF